MARREKRGVHPLRMIEALDLLNERIGGVVSAAHMARSIAEGDATAAQLKVLIDRIAQEADALRAAAWPDEED
jgi:hypothetical protein